MSVHPKNMQVLKPHHRQEMSAARNTEQASNANNSGNARGAEVDENMVASGSSTNAGSTPAPFDSVLGPNACQVELVNINDCGFPIGIRSEISTYPSPIARITGHLMLRGYNPPLYIIQSKRTFPGYTYILRLPTVTPPRTFKLKMVTTYRRIRLISSGNVIFRMIFSVYRSDMRSPHGVLASDEAKVTFEEALTSWLYSTIVTEKISNQPMNWVKVEFHSLQMYQP